MGWLRWLGARSNDGALANARAATTELSRRRVERHDVELYLRSRYADVAPLPPAARAGVAR